MGRALGSVSVQTAAHVSMCMCRQLAAHTRVQAWGIQPRSYGRCTSLERKVCDPLKVAMRRRVSLWILEAEAPCEACPRPGGCHGASLAAGHTGVLRRAIPSGHPRCWHPKAAGFREAPTRPCAVSPSHGGKKSRRSEGPGQAGLTATIQTRGFGEASAGSSSGPAGAGLQADFSFPNSFPNRPLFLPELLGVIGFFPER